MVKRTGDGMEEVNSSRTVDDWKSRRTGSGQKVYQGKCTRCGREMDRRKCTVDDGAKVDRRRTEDGTAMDWEDVSMANQI